MAKVSGLIVLLIVVVIGIWQGPAINKLFQQSFNKTQQNTTNLWENQIQIQEQKVVTEGVGNLTDSAKQQIDNWLTAKSLNEYGDKVGTVYTGGSPRGAEGEAGTPLFDEKTGKITDRYMYILKKHPEIVTELRLGGGN
ncbi:MAG: hypothetical protein NTV81_00530 [Candidatus Komeilibacteria bacterium]|nr:hypothetical protein [Candidatus Komeilibacteria bacterium]